MIPETMARGRPERIGVFGGTFDPIHVGHLATASECVQALTLDRLIFTPAGSPWQKEDASVSSKEDRYIMTVLAAVGDTRFEVSRVDIDRLGPSYTADTLRDLRCGREAQGLGAAEWLFIAGVDALKGIETWREFPELLSLATFVAATRPGQGRQLPPAISQVCEVVDVPGIDVSSTDCRERVRSGRTIAYLVPEPVVNYIAKTGLYGAGAR